MLYLQALVTIIVLKKIAVLRHLTLYTVVWDLKCGLGWRWFLYNCMEVVWVGALWF